MTSGTTTVGRATYMLLFVEHFSDDAVCLWVQGSTLRRFGHEHRELGEYTQSRR